MIRPKYDKYTKLVLIGITPKYKREVKFKDEIIPYETNHFTGKGYYKRIQMRYNSKIKQGQIVFLGYSPEEIVQAVKTRKHIDFSIQVNKESIDLSKSGQVNLYPVEANTGIHKYTIKKYIPFSSDTFKIYSRMCKEYFPDRNKIFHIDHPIIKHYLHTHLLHHIRYVMNAFTIYTEKEIAALTIQISGMAEHYVEKYKSKESAFNLTFTSNVWLPEDLNIGNHVAYGFGQLNHLDQWVL